MNCPRCEGILKKFVFQGIELDKCNKCGGLWFDEGEFKKLKDTGISVEEATELDKKLENELKVKSGKLRCPRCYNFMREINFMYTSPIKIDCCEVCGGMWLDSGELSAIIKFIEKETKIEKSEVERYKKEYEMAKVEGQKAKEQIEKALGGNKVFHYIYKFLDNVKLRLRGFE